MKVDLDSDHVPTHPILYAHNFGGKLIQIRSKRTILFLHVRVKTPSLQLIFLQNDSLPSIKTRRKSVCVFKVLRRCRVQSSFEDNVRGVDVGKSEYDCCNLS